MATWTYAFTLAGQLNQLGEPLYRKLEPTGYSNQSGELDELGVAAGAHELRDRAGAGERCRA